MQPLELGGGAAGEIPATSPASSAGEVAREGPGVERPWWRCSFVADATPAGGHGGDPRRRPLGALLRRAGGSGRPTSERGAFVEQEEDRSGTVGQCKRPEHRFTVTP
jgi:hypothetical protein